MSALSQHGPSRPQHDMAPRGSMGTFSLAQTLALIVAICGLAPLLAGCGGIFDVAYLIGNKTTDQTVEQRTPTGQVHTAKEFEGAPGDDGVVRLTCAERDRRVERSSQVHKTYRYRGGYTSMPYIGAAVLSGVTAGAVAGIAALICENDQKSTPDEKQSCLTNMLFATPFVVDSVYSTVRAATAKDPKLVEKTVSNPVLSFAETPSRSDPLRCDASRVYLKDGTGPRELSPQETLEGNQEDKVPLSLEGATPVLVAPDGTIPLRQQPDLVSRWAENPNLLLWLVDPDGKAHRLNVDRCKALRPVMAMLHPNTQIRFTAQCPAPPPPPPSR